MPKRYLLPVLEFHLLIFLIALAVITKPSTFVLSATTHVVISEVQVQGDNGAADEFIELYNPTNSVVDISSWSIQRETTTGSFEKKNFEASDSIPAQGYFLITNSGYNGSTSSDMSHSSFDLSSTGTTVFLVNDQVQLTTGEESTIVDKVAIGSSAVDAENSPFGTIPGNDASIERKPGVSDPSGGNGTDTENNANDFALRDTSEPQNNASAIETPAPDATPSPTPDISPSPTPDSTPDVSPSPSATPETTPSPTPEASSSPTPDVSPTPTPEASPSPTPEVSASPTPEASASPTPEPTPEASPEPSPSSTPVTSPSPTPEATPEVSPSPTPEITPSPTPEASPSSTPDTSPSPTPDTTPTPSATPEASPSSSPETTVSPTPVPSPSPSPEARVFFRGFLFTCSVRYVKINTGWFSFSLPRFSCISNG